MNKLTGQVFTPDYLVDNILNYSGYGGSGILRRHSMDNSCGDGAFLCAMVKRYCQEFLSVSKDNRLLKRELETFFHGIDKDPVACHRCKSNLDDALAAYGISNVRWDIVNADALLVTKYDNKMDFVIGNPPYVRIHNLEGSYGEVRLFNFTKSGMTDLYLAFFEKGINMLRPGGYLCYVTPNSWIHSVAGSGLRDYISSMKCLKEVVDIGHFQPFNATTYTMITLLQKDHSFDSIWYYSYDGERKERKFVDDLAYEDAFINGQLFLGRKQTLDDYRKIVTSHPNHYVQVKNGFSTQTDNVFIQDRFDFTEMTIPVLKGSTGQWRKAFFPYNSQGKPYSKEEIFSHCRIAEWLESNKDSILRGRSERDYPYWYLYGRTQALGDVNKYKISINTIIKDVDTVKLSAVDAGKGVYSGLYILGSRDYPLVSSILRSQEFVDFVALMKTYKRGGYFAFRAKDVETYLNYMIDKRIRDGEVAVSSPLAPLNIVSKDTRQLSLLRI